ncbi:N-acetylglucosamine-6-phosphate deacetylase [Sinisalibacter aestuarii]|uniref:N-acetylglucosamine-6-phosphate deacetylase n=1 Tax=Sinisalibacter aestuarii TaxID=2949426 RepID=A0ABQ5LQU0_9RHOB|nr:N-acetylglucosamine-6-phosphate deacetylase [Sinisalibacter aestuarii]GKY87375.1 N-acetylglucosamine-6-phosphate deacetylase [Sinisalibacter aestuarii]
MTQPTAYLGAEIFDGHVRHHNAALLVADGRVAAIMPEDDLPAGAERIALDGGLIAPGFVDLQVNGGGGVMLNNAPTADTIRTICEGHVTGGTTSILPTLITDAPEITRAAIAATRAALAEGVPGLAGLHLEGPHLSLARKGAHDPALIRPMDEDDLTALEALAAELPTLLVTVAPESVRPEQIARLARAGATVSLGHTDCSYAAATEATASGARMATHLFNAMSQFTGREPGLVGAVLDTGALWAGLIADGFHVSPASIRVALAAKQGPGRIFLVSDSMATTGTALDEFTLNGRRILRRGGRLTLEDGTLAGADLDLAGAVRFMAGTIGLDPLDALRMATLHPAQAIGRDGEIGTLTPGSHADFVHLDDALRVQKTWRRDGAVY